MCQEALDLEISNGEERTDSKCKKDKDHDLQCRTGPPAEFRRVSMRRLLHWSGQQQHLLQWLQALGAQEMQCAQAFDKRPWLPMYKVPGNCTPLGWQTTEGSQGQTWQAWGGSFLLLPRRHTLSSRWLQTFNHNTCENRLEEVQGSATSSFFTPPLFQNTWQGNDQTDLQCQAARHCHYQVQWATLRLALRIWTSFWRREDSNGMNMWNAPMVQSRQPLTYRLMGSVGLGGPRWHGSSWQREIAESGSSRLSTLMIDIPGELVWDLPCVQQASYLEGGPLMWMLPLYLTLIKNLIMMIWCCYKFTYIMANSANNLQKPTDLDLHCLQRHGIFGLSRTRVNTINT